MTTLLNRILGDRKMSRSRPTSNPVSYHKYTKQYRDEEILKIALNIHKIGKPCLETVLGWKVFYKPRQRAAYTTTNVNCITGEKGSESDPKEIIMPAEFTFGYDAPWKIVFSWKNGDDNPPSKYTYGEDKLVRVPMKK
jgi:hypothetical protein